MAIHRWVSTDGDFSAAASWSSGIAPSAWAASDECLFDGTSSQVDATTGLGQGLVDIARFVVTDNYSGNIGVTGTPLELDSTKTIFLGTGKFIFDRSTGTAGSSWILIDSASKDRHIIDGVFNQIFVKRGTANISIRVTGTSIYMLDRRVGIKILDVTVQYGDIYCFDGQTEIQGDIAATSGNGLFVFGGTTIYNPQSGSADMAILQTGGTIDYRAVLDSATTNGSWFLLDGTMDLRKAIGAGWPSTPDIVVGPTMNIIEPSFGFPSDSIRADLRDKIPQ